MAIPKIPVGMDPSAARKQRVQQMATNAAAGQTPGLDPSAARRQRIQGMATNAAAAKQTPQYLGGLQDKRRQMISTIRSRGGAAANPGVANRLHNLTGQIQGIRAQQNPVQPPATPPTEPAATLPNTSDPNNEQARTQLPNEETQAQVNALFPGQRAFLPENYQGSPLYQFQANEGQKRLDKMYAARGLTGSGAEIGGNTQFLNELGARESDRQQGVAQTEADRLYNFYQDEANRKERVGNEQFDRAYSLTDLALSQNPMQYTYGAAGDLANQYNQQGQINANYRKDRYGRVRGGGGGGGGGGYPAPFQAPFPTSPNFTGIDLQSPVLNQNSNFGWMSGLGEAGAALFNAYRNGTFG